MEAQMIYPTAPSGAHAEEVEHVESPGKPEGMMGKVKRKARNLRDKIKKAAGTDSTDNDDGDINSRDQKGELHQHAPGLKDEEVDEGAESCENDEEEHDHINPADNQVKYQQLHSIGKLDNQEGGPEVEVHGGAPLSATPDTHPKRTDDEGSVNPYTNDGPPDALQPTSTKHHDYVAHNDPLLELGGEGKTTTDISDEHLVLPAEGSNPRGMNQQPDSLNLPTYAEGKMATSPAGASRSSATSDMDDTYPEDLRKPNPEFGYSSSATYEKIGVMNEDLSTDRKLGTSEDYSNKSKEASVPECAELSGCQSSASAPVEGNELVCDELSGYQSSASAKVEGDELVRMNVSEMSGHQSSAPMPIEANEFVSDPDVGSFPTPPPGILDGVVKELNEIAEVAGPGQSIDISDVRAFENDLEYPSTHDDVKSSSLEQSLHGETAEPEQNWSANKHNEVYDEGFSRTSPPGIVDDVTYEPNAVTQCSGTGETLDDRNSAFAMETDYPGTESKLISDTADGVENLSLAHGETAEPEKNQPESWCKSSADNQNNAKDVVTAGLLGSDNTSESDTQQSGADGWNNNAVHADVAMRVGGGDRAPNSQQDEYVDALSKPQVSEDVRKDVDDEKFYDPNDDKDNQFQEGFALSSGNADEVAINSPLPGSAIVAESEHKPEVDIDGSQPQTAGALPGLNNVVASKLEYETAGKLPSPPSENMHTHNTPVETTADVQPRYDDDGEHGGVGKASVAGDDAGEPHSPQPAGFFQGMKNMVASTLGYKGSEGEHTAETGHMSHDEVPVSST